MANNLIRIPLEEFSRHVTDVFARVVHEQQAVVVEGAAGELAVLQPVRPATRRPRGRKKTAADYEAFLSAAGSWSDVDVDMFIHNVYESRRNSSRPPVQL